MKEKYAPFLVSTKGKALVLLGSAALLAAGVYGVTQVRLIQPRMYTHTFFPRGLI